MDINETEACTHAEPYPGYVDKHKRRRFHKGKTYVWTKCPGCNVIFMGVFWPQVEEVK
jgi:hypothetical protein